MEETYRLLLDESLEHEVLERLVDAGHDVLAYGVLPEKIPECLDADAHLGCEHLLFRQAD